MRRIPVIVLAGFLGSGKTTVVNHLLRNSGGTRIGVVVNDFGAVNIDAMLVAGQVDAMVSLSNGCLCCAVDASELDDMLARLTRPGAMLDAIVVEASGLAEPRSLVRMVVGSENPRIGYGGLVEVVDAELYPDTRRTHPDLDAHLRLADLVVLNKADRVAPEQLSLLTKELGELVGGVPVFPTSHGRVDATLLVDPPAHPRRAEQLSFDDLLRADTDHSDHDHLHDRYTSVEFATDAPLHPRRLVALLEDPPPGLFRAKGYVVLAGGGRFLLHLVGRHLVLEPARGGARTELVCIGAGLDAAALRTRLAETQHPGDPEPDAMLAAYRYIPDMA